MAQILSWRTILDIILIAAALFFLYKTLIRLGTWKIVTGILIAAAVFIISSYMGLKGIEWIYRNASHVAVIGIIILFQPELRKLFERAASIRGSKIVNHDNAFARIITESVWKLAAKRVGAIIVIPEREEISQWVNGGYPLNALPSVPLILSIFDPNSPGHDGALIVHKGMFTSFGVRLPVSQSGRLGEEYGTRHQSAMGLSEKSDALIVTVSEERGKVSVFHKGEIRVMDREEDVFISICAHCSDAAANQLDRPVRKINKTITLEIIGSLAIAFAFWATIIPTQGEMLEKIITVPVEYTATTEDVVMIGEKATEISLHLAGSKSDLDAASSSALSVKINLAKVAEGTQTFLINDDNIRLPKGVRLIDVNPSNVEITIAKRVRRELEINPQLVGKLPDGLKLVSMEVKPRTLQVLLPLDTSGLNLNNITTTPVYLDSIRDDTRLFCKIISPPSIQPVDKRWPDVEVMLTVKPLESMIENNTSLPPLDQQM